jgi:hypothetical protein
MSTMKTIIWTTSVRLMFMYQCLPDEGSAPISAGNFIE